MGSLRGSGRREIWLVGFFKLEIVKTLLGLCMGFFFTYGWYEWYRRSCFDCSGIWPSMLER